MKTVITVITQDQQTTCNGIAVFQKCKQLFNKQGIGMFIFAVRWRCVETEKLTDLFSNNSVA